jgi:Zn finger protein HypA/HybF involved in hydrogenase expression
MRNSYTKEQLEVVVASSTTWADVCRKLGVQPMTGSQSHVKKRAVDFGILFTHFVGNAFNKGRTFDKKDALEYCFSGSTVSSHRLKKYLIRDGYKEKRCEKCGLDEWMGEDIPLELHHKDSNHSNNEFKNLVILCPNCHAIEDAKMGM